MAEEKFKGTPYPITKHPLGYLRVQSGVDTIRSDLLVLLLTNPRERVMLPEYGTPLRALKFRPSDETTQEEAREAIINAISLWEPRITVDQIEVGFGDMIGEELAKDDPRLDDERILAIRIVFFDPEDIQNVQQLKLDFPL